SKARGKRLRRLLPVTRHTRLGRVLGGVIIPLFALGERARLKLAFIATIGQRISGLALALRPALAVNILGRFSTRTRLLFHVHNSVSTVAICESMPNTR